MRKASLLPLRGFWRKNRTRISGRRSDIPYRTDARSRRSQLPEGVASAVVTESPESFLAGE